MHKYLKQALSYILTFCTVFSTVYTTELPTAEAGTIGYGMTASGGAARAFSNNAGGILTIAEPIIRVGISRDASLYNNGTVTSKINSLVQWGNRIPQNTETTMYFVDDVTYDGYYTYSTDVPATGGSYPCPVSLGWYNTSTMQMDDNLIGRARIKRLDRNATDFIGYKGRGDGDSFASADAHWWDSNLDCIDWNGGTNTESHPTGYTVRHIVEHVMVTGDYNKREVDTSSVSQVYSTTGTYTLDGVQYECNKFSDLAKEDANGEPLWKSFAAGQYTDGETGWKRQAYQNISYFFENVDSNGSTASLKRKGNFTLKGNTDFKGYRLVNRICNYISPGIALCDENTGLMDVDLSRLDPISIDKIKAGYLDVLLNFYILADESSDDVYNPGFADAWEEAINDFLTGDYDVNEPPSLLIDICTDVVANTIDSNGKPVQGRPSIDCGTDANATDASSVVIVSAYDYLQWSAGTSSAYNIYGDINQNVLHKYDVDRGGTIWKGYPDSTTTGEFDFVDRQNNRWQGDTTVQGLLKYCVQETLSSNPVTPRGGDIINGQESSAPLPFGRAAAGYRYARIYTPVNEDGKHEDVYLKARDVDYSYVDILRQNYGIDGSGTFLNYDPSRAARGEGAGTLEYPKASQEYGVTGFVSFSFDLTVPSFSYEFQIDSPVPEGRDYSGQIPEVIFNDNGRTLNQARHKPGNTDDISTVSPMYNLVPWSLDSSGVRRYNSVEAYNLAYGEGVTKHLLDEDGTYEWVDEAGNPTTPADNPYILKPEEAKVVMTYTAKGGASGTNLDEEDILESGLKNLRKYAASWERLFTTTYGKDPSEWDRYNLYLYMGNVPELLYAKGRKVDNNTTAPRRVDSAFGVLQGSRVLKDRTSNTSVPYNTNPVYSSLYKNGTWAKNNTGFLAYDGVIDSKITDTEYDNDYYNGDAGDPRNWHYSPISKIWKTYKNSYPNSYANHRTTSGGLLENYGVITAGLESNTYFATANMLDKAFEASDEQVSVNFPRLKLWMSLDKTHKLSSTWNSNTWYNGEWSETGEASSRANHPVYSLYINDDNGMPSGEEGGVFVDDVIDNWEENFLNYTGRGTNGRLQGGAQDEAGVAWFQEQNGLKGGVIKPSEWLTFLNGWSTLAVMDYSALGAKLYNGEMLGKDYLAPLTVFYKTDPADSSSSWSWVTGEIDDWDKMDAKSRHCSGRCKGYLETLGRDTAFCTCAEEGITDGGVDSDWVYKYLYDGWDMVTWRFPYEQPKISTIPDDDRVQVDINEKASFETYSSAPENYVEIKEGEPGGERYEAMAGVPTTETLYFTSGGSEFKVDLTVEYEPNQKSVWRTYINQYSNVLNADGANATIVDCEFNTEGKDIWPGIKNGRDVKTGTTYWNKPVGASTVDMDLNHNGDREIKLIWTGDVEWSKTLGAYATVSGSGCSSTYSLSDKWDWTAYQTAYTNAVNWVNAFNKVMPEFRSASDNVLRKIGTEFSGTLVTEGAVNSSVTLKDNTDITVPEKPSVDTKPLNGTNASGTSASHGCPGHGGGEDSPPSYDHCGDKTATAKDGVKGTFTITVTLTLPDDHMLCGPCCGHKLPPIQDAWKQNVEFDTMRIVSMDVYQITEGKLKGVDSVSVDKNKTVYSEIIQGKPTIYYNIAEENARSRMRDGIPEERNGDINAKGFLAAFESTIKWTDSSALGAKIKRVNTDNSKIETVPAIDNMGWIALPYGEHTADGNWQQLGIYKDRYRHEQANSSLDGRLRYSYETDQHEFVTLCSKEARSRTCNGAWHTSCVDEDGDTKKGNVCPSINDPNAPSRDITFNGYTVKKPAGILLLNYDPLDTAEADSSKYAEGIQERGIYCTGHFTFRNDDDALANTIKISTVGSKGVKDLINDSTSWKNEVWGTGIIYNNPIHNGWEEDANAKELDKLPDMTGPEGTATKLTIDYRPYGGNGDSKLDEGEEAWYRVYKNAAAVNNGMRIYDGTTVKPDNFKTESDYLGETLVRNSTEDKKTTVVDLGITSATSADDVDYQLRHLTLDIDANPDWVSGATFYADGLDVLTKEWSYMTEKTRRQENIVTMITDFLILQTTSGDQVPLYYTKSSKEQKSTLTVTAEGIYPKIEVTKKDMWDNNPNSAANWDSSDINLGSYNGKYSDVLSRIYGDLGAMELPGKFKGTGSGRHFNTIFETNSDYVLFKWMNFEEELPDLSKQIKDLRDDVFSRVKWGKDFNKKSLAPFNKVNRVFSYTDEDGRDLWRNSYWTSHQNNTDNFRIIYTRPECGHDNGDFEVWKSDIDMVETLTNGEYGFGTSTVFYELIESYRGLDTSAGGYVVGFPLTDELRALGYTCDYVQDGVEYYTKDLDGEYIEDCRFFAPFMTEEAYDKSSRSYGDIFKGKLYNKYCYPDIMKFYTSAYSSKEEWLVDSRYIHIEDYAKGNVSKNRVIGHLVNAGEHKGENRFRLGFTNTATYSPNHTSINSIVIFDPVSVEYSYVNGLPAYRDQRTNAIATGGAQDLMNKINELKVCPRTPGECEFRVLNCKVHDDEVLFDSDFTKVKGNIIYSKVKEFTNNEELNDYLGTLTDAAKLSLEAENNILYKKYTLPQGLSISGGVLNLNSKSFDIAFDNLGVNGFTPGSSSTLEVEMNISYSGSSKPFFLLGMEGYGYFVGNPNTSADAETYNKGSWVSLNDATSAYTNENKDSIKINTTAGYMSDSQVVTANRRSDLRLDINTSNLKANKVYLGNGAGTYTEVSQTQKTKGASVADYIGDTLHIGAWGINSNYNGNFKVNRLKIVKKGITEGCSEACFSVNTIHATNNAHVHSEDCVDMISNEPVLVCGKEETGTTNVPAGTVYNFGYTGDVQSVELQPGTYKLETWGAEGGGSRLSGNTNSGLGGLGGYSSGTLVLSKVTTLYVGVGGAGKSSTNGKAEGGYNGGGSGYASSSSEPGNGGGGATHIATMTGTLKSLANARNNAVILVAGGGGGGGEDAADAYGHGGGTTCVFGNTASGGSTSTTSVTSFNATSATAGTNGGFGYGASTKLGDGGGGGGGYFGGGSLSAESTNTDTQGGGGGSGFANTLTLANKLSFSGSTVGASSTTKAVPSYTNGTLTNGNTGNGYARITVMSDIIGHRHTDACYSLGGNYLLTCTKSVSGTGEEDLKVRDFDFSRTVESVNLSAGTYKLEVWGAQGGSSNWYTGGLGGYSSGVLTISSPTTVYVCVGEQGKKGDKATAVVAGGYNGGGQSYGATSSSYDGISGGGATHIALASGELKSLSSNKSSILLVAGGGGGAAGYSKKTGNGGYGGGTVGGDGVAYGSYGYGTGGSQTSAGINSYTGTSNSNMTFYSGGFGYGGYMTTTASNSGWVGAGGGGGYYGGGCGGAISSGGGGSGYVNTSKLASPSILSGNEDIPSLEDANITEVGHSGNGFARITTLSLASDHHHSLEAGCYTEISATSYKCDVNTVGTSSTYNSHVHTESCSTTTDYACNNLPLNTNKVYTCGFIPNTDPNTGNITYNESTNNVFTAPATGYYNVSIRGGDGGRSTTAISAGVDSGKGGITTGQVYLKKGEKLYFSVGSSANGLTPGTNGGGYARGSASVAAAGGGMTYVSKTIPTTSESASSSRPKYLIALTHQPRGCTYNNKTHYFESYSSSVTLCGGTELERVCPHNTTFTVSNSSTLFTCNDCELTLPDGTKVPTTFCRHNCGISNGGASYRIISANLGSSWDDSSLVMVAGGGGGTTDYDIGGDAGGTSGQGVGPSYDYVNPGTQTTAGQNAGSGFGGSVEPSKKGAGGGSGYYGGGSGIYGGAGGSSFINNAYVTDGATYADTSYGRASANINWNINQGHKHTADCTYQYALHTHTVDCEQASYYTCGAIEKNRHVCLDETTRMERSYTLNKYDYTSALLTARNFENTISNLWVRNATAKASPVGAMITANTAGATPYIYFDNLNLDASLLDHIDVTLMSEASPITIKAYAYNNNSHKGISNTVTYANEDIKNGFVTISVPLTSSSLASVGTLTTLDLDIKNSTTNPIYIKEIKVYAEGTSIKGSHKVADWDFKGSLNGFARSTYNNVPIKAELESKYLTLYPNVAKSGIIKDLSLSNLKEFNTVELSVKASQDMTMFVNTGSEEKAISLTNTNDFNTYRVSFNDTSATQLSVLFTALDNMANALVSISNIKLMYKGTDGDETAMYQWANDNYLKGEGDTYLTDDETLGVLKNTINKKYTASSANFLAWKDTEATIYSNSYSGAGYWHTCRKAGEVGFTLRDTNLNVSANSIQYIDMRLKLSSYTSSAYTSDGLYAKVYFKTSDMSDFDNKHFLVARVNPVTTATDSSIQTVRFETASSPVWKGTITGLRFVPCTSDYDITTTTARKYCSYVYSVELMGTASSTDLKNTYTYGPGDTYCAGTYEVKMVGTNLDNVKFSATGTSNGMTVTYPMSLISKTSTEATYVLSVTADTDNLQIVSKPLDLHSYTVDTLNIKGINLTQPLMWCNSCNAYVKVYANDKNVVCSSGHTLFTSSEKIMTILGSKGTGATYKDTGGNICYTNKGILIFGTNGKRQRVVTVPGKQATSLLSVTDNTSIANYISYTYIPDLVCIEEYVSACTEPHHKGQHYDVSDTRCYDACMNDDNHKIKWHEDESDQASKNGKFINLDYTFKITFPNYGDFEGSEDFGLSKTSRNLGPGYTNRMDTTRWTREKTVSFDFDVLFLGPELDDGSLDKVYWTYIPAHTTFQLPICSDYTPDEVNSYYDNLDCAGGHTCFEEHNGYVENCGGTRFDTHVTERHCDVYNAYRFYCVLKNDEAKAARVHVGVEAINNVTSQKRGRYTDNEVGEIMTNQKTAMKSLYGLRTNCDISNFASTSSKQRYEYAYGKMYTDVVGRIGNLMTLDSEDYRFANLFKVAADKASVDWIIPGVVQGVVQSQQKRYYASSTEDIRGYPISTNTNWLNTYGTHEWLSRSLVLNEDGSYEYNYDDENEPDCYWYDKDNKRHPIRCYVATDFDNSTLVEVPMQYPISPVDNQGTTVDVDYTEKFDDYSKPNESKDVIMNYDDKLTTQYLRLGYSLFTSIETIGNYWRPDVAAMQIVPYYYAIDLSKVDKSNPSHITSALIPLDVYIKTGGTYQPINIFGNVKSDGTLYYDDFYYNTVQLNWADEKARRMYTSNQYNITNRVAAELSKVMVTVNSDDTETETIKNFSIPNGNNIYIGSTQRLYLGKVAGINEGGEARTFIGSPIVYNKLWGMDETGKHAHVAKNYEYSANYLNDYLSGWTCASTYSPVDWAKRGQRWHFSLGLPSSAVFVRHNTNATTNAEGKWDESQLTPVTTENLEEISGDNMVVMMAVDIIIKGDIYTLQWQRPYMRNADGSFVTTKIAGTNEEFRKLQESVIKFADVGPDGLLVTKSLDLNDYYFTKQPIALYASNQSAEQDVMIEKTH